MAKIVFIVGKSGKVQAEVQGVKGAACLKVVDAFRTAVQGSVSSETSTSEAFEFEVEHQQLSQG